MRNIRSVLAILALLFLLAACASPTVEPQDEPQPESQSTRIPTPASEPTSRPTAEVAAQTQATVAEPTETSTQSGPADPSPPPDDATTLVPDQPAQSPGDRKTGIPEVDSVIDTILSNDLDARRSLIRIVTAGCTTADGLGTIPTCESGQAEGTLVDFFPLGGPGEGHSVAASEIARVLDFEAESLYAAYVVSEDIPDQADFPQGKYVLFFTTASNGESNDVSVILRVDDEGYIVRLDGLAGMPLDFYFQQMAADLIDPPPQTVMFASEAAEILVYPPESEP